jgi:GntR family transcriptional regulator
MGLVTKIARLGSVPLYLQIATTLRRRLEAGRWVAGSKISTIEELQSEFKVARVTVRQALELLEREGLLRCQQGKGTFVSENLGERRWLKVAPTWRSQLDILKEVAASFVSRDMAPPRPRLGPDEGKPAAAYVLLRSIESRDGEAFGIVNVHLAKHVYARDRSAFRNRPALAVLAEMPGVTIAGARQTFVIGRADAETARLLHIAPDAPTAEARWVILDKAGVAVYVAAITYRGDLIKLEIDLAAPSARELPRSRRATRRSRAQ